MPKQEKKNVTRGIQKKEKQTEEGPKNTTKRKRRRGQDSEILAQAMLAQARIAHSLRPRVLSYCVGMTHTIVDHLAQRVVKGFIEDIDFLQERISERIGEWAIDVSSGKQMVDVLTQVVMQESAFRSAGGNSLLRCPCRTS